MKVLIADDDAISRRILQVALTKWGYETVATQNGREAWEVLQQTDAPRMAVLDWMMPELDGIEVCQEVRKRSGQSYTYLLLLTSKSHKAEIIAGLNAGADDYLTKPFALEELLARVRALMRRGNEDQGDEILTIGDLELNLERHETRRAGISIELTAKEFDLLAYLMRNNGRVLSKPQIMDHVWGYDAEATSNVVEIYIHYLRDKIDRDHDRPLIRTVRGVGYTIKS